ncbi:uncharacterized protein BT62DRAFT_938606 [Guyanagaster necrorhizus]|uniref:Uncharacterized protein n=1 Tax=Guyanagaster necrorhizus TaxID=856835 RepID=A0A9P7VF59_9AGAR|nr:uncharacterized protein BT62DRAFT_938606 [Guyanagaster necrorhizus MCA 3950]KAG7439816.1 hypothetical protein BT62DRAFT_938606 [Guyanagaster necrorhizus MCA 3950]
MLRSLSEDADACASQYMASAVCFAARHCLDATIDKQYCRTAVSSVDGSNKARRSSRYALISANFDSIDC